MLPAFVCVCVSQLGADVWRGGFAFAAHMPQEAPGRERGVPVSVFYSMMNACSGN